MKKCLCLLLGLLLLASSARAESAASYLYDEFETVVPAPPAYALERSITARDLPGVAALDGLTDAYVSDDCIYVLCATRLLLLERDFSLRAVLTGYVDETGKELPFSGCTGVTEGKNGEYYISQSENSQILHFSADHTLLRVLGRPEITGFENVNYRPTKLALDQAGRLYVISKGMYEGIVELSADGSFNRFFGVNEVRFTPWQMLWRVFATKEQRARQAMWLPSDFTNLCVDADGFLFATLLSQDNKPIKRLNAKGENIIKVANGKPYPSGDLHYNESGFGIPTGASQFIAVDANKYGAYICLDSTRSRVFGYNEDHELLFIFGGPGDREGYFRNPVDACFVDEKILVLDSLAQSLEIFSQTQYGQALMRAVRAQYAYQYEDAAQDWQQALSLNHNLFLAYSGIGRARLRAGDYDGAMEYLKQGGDREYYDKAYEKVRNRNMRAAFVPSVIGVFALIVLAAVIRGVRKRKKGASPARAPRLPLARRLLEDFWLFPWRVLARPFKRFDEMKFERKGSYPFAFFMLALSALLSAVEFVENGFLINYNDVYSFNSLYLCLTVLFPVALFAVSNWCVTTLMDGKGKLGEIFQVMMYAMFPLCLTRITGLALSNFLTLDEMPLYYALQAVGAAAFCLYLFIGLIVVHEYSFGRGVGSLALTFAAMMVVLFILMLVFTLTADLWDFITVFSKELMLKIF